MNFGLGLTEFLMFPAILYYAFIWNLEARDFDTPVYSGMLTKVLRC